MDVPRPGPGQVRVRLEGCGVCGSNVPVWEGREWFDYPRPPGSPGHEGWGDIDALGDGVDASRLGERVATLSFHAFATHDICGARDAIAIPAEVESPFPGEALGCAMNVSARGGFAPGQRIAVVGVGFLGALLVQLASRAGATVVGVSRRDTALQAARAMGAHDTVVARDDPSVTAGEVADRLGGLCDVVVEAAGAQGALDIATALTAERGRLVVAGFHQDGPRSVDMQTWNWRGIDVINAHERAPEAYRRGVRAAAHAVAGGRLDPAVLYTHRFTLDELGDALEAATQRPEGFMKALVMVEGS